MRLLFILPVLYLIAFPALSDTDNRTEPTDPPEGWFIQGQQWLQQKTATSGKAASGDVQKPRNLILFIGDGMSITTLTAARIREGQLAGNSGEEHFLYFERFPQTALIKTYNANQQTPDSAGTMSAMMTGVKTRAGVIGLGPEQDRSVCFGSDDHKRQNLFEWAYQRNMATGVVTDVRITHATPAAAYAHAAERSWEGDDDLTFEAKLLGCESIARQLITEAFPAGLDLAMGVGSHTVQSYFEAFRSQFPDGALIRNSDELGALAEHTNEQSPVLAVFDEPSENSAEESVPSLADMVRAGIRNLNAMSRNTDGFILIAEAGRIDYAHHDGNAYNALEETIALAEAVQAADEMTDDADTLIIVTADHSHTLTMSGYQPRGNPVLDLVRDEAGNPRKALDDLAYTTLGYANGKGGGHHDARSAGRIDPEKLSPEESTFYQAALTPLAYETHGSDDVALHAKGPGAELFGGLLEQHSLFHLFKHLMTREPAQ